MYVGYVKVMGLPVWTATMLSMETRWLTSVESVWIPQIAVSIEVKFEISQWWSKIIDYTYIIECMNVI